MSTVDKQKPFVDAKTTKLIGIYHKECTDGYFAGALLKHYFDQTEVPYELIGMDYRDPVLEDVDLTGAMIYMVDFSAPPEVIRRLADTAVGVAIYDHHDSAVRRFDDLPEGYFPNKNVTTVFDVTCSGAMLVYRELTFPYISIGDIRHYTRIIQRVSAWDLQLPEASDREHRSFAAYAKACLRSLETVSEFLTTYVIDGLTSDNRILEAGSLLVELEDDQSQWAIDNTLRVITLEVPNGEGSVDTYENVALINAPKYLCTQIGRMAAEDYPIVLVYHDCPEGRILRFMSKKGGIVVNTIAEKFGGGGHPHSAGILVLRDSYLGRL